MKNLGRALLLLTLGLVLLSQAAMAQDALSVVLPSPYSSRVGTQLVYWFEQTSLTAYAGTRGEYQSYLTIVNTNTSQGVWVHFQFYTSACTEVFDFVDYLTPNDKYVFDPGAGIRGTYGVGMVGVAAGVGNSDTTFIMTATPVRVSGYSDPPNASDLRARSFNWLTGQIWIAHRTNFNVIMTNAIPRMAVDQWGGPLLPNGDPFSLTVGGGSREGAIIDGVTTFAGQTGAYFLQYFRPVLILVNAFFAPTTVEKTGTKKAFGNRMSFLVWNDDYTTGAVNMYRIKSETVTLNSFVFDESENGYSTPSRDVKCLTEFTIAPDSPGGINFSDFIGAALNAAVKDTGGWVKMRPASYPSIRTNLVGVFSQYLAGWSGADYMIGQGRNNSTFVITTTDSTSTRVSSAATMWWP